MNEDKPELDLEICFPDYIPDADRDDDEMYHIKSAFDTALNYIEKKIFVQYMELGGTYTALARYYGVTPPTAKATINKIRQKIYDNL